LLRGALEPRVVGPSKRLGCFGRGLTHGEKVPTCRNKVFDRSMDCDSDATLLQCSQKTHSRESPRVNGVPPCCTQYAHRRRARNNNTIHINSWSLYERHTRATRSSRRPPQPTSPSPENSDNNNSSLPVITHHFRRPVTLCDVSLLVLETVHTPQHCALRVQYASLSLLHLRNLKLPGPAATSSRVLTREPQKKIKQKTTKPETKINRGRCVDCGLRSATFWRHRPSPLRVLLTTRSRG